MEGANCGVEGICDCSAFSQTTDSSRQNRAKNDSFHGVGSSILSLCPYFRLYVATLLFLCYNT